VRLFLPTGPDSAPEGGLFSQAERKRMIMLVVLFFIVVGMFSYGIFRGARGKPGAPEEAAPTPRPEAAVITPEVDLDALGELAHDATEEERLVVEGPALQELFRPARLLADAHYDAMGGRLLDAETAAALRANPDAERGALFRARGWIEEIQAVDTGASATAHYRGRLRLEDGGAAWFAVLALSDVSGEVDDFVRIDGLLLKLFRRGAAGGEMLEAPFLVGPRAVQSFPAVGAVTALEPNEFQFVEDDSPAGITGQPFHEYWMLVSYALHGADDVDWSSAPLVDGETMADIYENGTAWRGVPVRIPPAELMDIWDQRQEENPARVARLAEGWAGNWEWAKHTGGVVRFVAPFERGALRRGDAFTARGFFLKNLAYEPAQGGMAMAPFFVLHSIEGFTPVENNTWTVIFGIMAGSLVVMACLFYAGVMRDRKKARQLQDELRRRRRARRDKRDADGGDTGAQPQQS